MATTRRAAWPRRVQLAVAPNVLQPLSLVLGRWGLRIHGCLSGGVPVAAVSAGVPCRSAAVPLPRLKASRLAGTSFGGKTKKLPPKLHMQVWPR